MQADMDRDDLVIKKTGQKGAHPNCMCTNKEVLRGQHDGGNSLTFPGKLTQQGTSLKCYTLMSAA